MYKLSQQNAIIVYYTQLLHSAVITRTCLQFLNSKASLLFAGQNDLFYDCCSSYDSFVASVTHLFEVALQSERSLV